MAIASPPSVVATTTGLRVMASVDRIATCGWLMIGIVSTEPAEPLLEIVNVPPLISSGISFFVRARPARSLMCAGDRPQPQVLGVADDRHDEALVVEVDGDAEVDEAVDDEVVLADAGVEVRELERGRRSSPG